MFRPTHFAILFAVILCAYAFPAAPSAPPHGRALRAAAPGPRPSSPGKTELRGALPKREVAKGDLDTDATEYWGYRYNDFYGSRWATYEPDVLIPTVYGWPTYYY